MTTSTDQLVDAVSDAIVAAMRPLVERVKVTEATIATLTARLAAVETAPPSAKWWHGVYADDVEYPTGAAVTYDGSLWVAETTTRARPGTDRSGWKLIVKRGEVRK